MKPYNLGLIVGRFQVFHLGHVDMIEKALAICERVILFIGSAQECRTAKNPFDFVERAAMIASAFDEAVKNDKLVIYPLADAGIGNNAQWGDYILSKVPEEYGKPDITISGRESRRSTWFDNQDIAELFVNKTIDISASKMREYLKSDEKFLWEAYSPPEISHMYNKLRTIILETQDITNTESI